MSISIVIDGKPVLLSEDPVKANPDPKPITAEGIQKIIKELNDLKGDSAFEKEKETINSEDYIMVNPMPKGSHLRKSLSPKEIAEQLGGLNDSVLEQEIEAEMELIEERFRQKPDVLLRAVDKFLNKNMVTANTVETNTCAAPLVNYYTCDNGIGMRVILPRKSTDVHVGKMDLFGSSETIRAVTDPSYNSNSEGETSVADIVEQLRNLNP